MTRQARIAILEAKHGGADAGPNVIFLCDATTGESGAALLMGSGGLVREAGETADAFTARASAGPSGAVYLPDNGRDALATGMGER
jgi:hypothetical protein